MANIEIPVSLGLKDALSQINLLRLALQQSVKLDSSAGKSLTSILDSALKSVDKLTGKMSNAFKSASGSSSFLKDYEKMIELLTTATLKMTNLGVTDIQFSVSDLQVVDSTIQKILSLLQALESIQDGKAIEVIKVSLVNGIDNLRQLLAQLKIDASKLSFNEIGDKLEEAANLANTEVKDLTNNILNINSLIGKLNTQGFLDIAKLSDFSTKGVSRILDAGNVDSVNDKLLKLAATMTDITVKPMTATAGLDITAFITSLTQAIEKQYNRLILTILSKKDEINSIINDVTLAGARTSKNGTVSYGHWTNELMLLLMSMPSVENIIKKLKEDTSLNFDSLGIRLQFAKFKEALNLELLSLNTQLINLLQLRDNVKTEVTKVFDNVGEAVVGSKSLLQSSIKNLFANLGISGDELKKIFDINSISSGEKMLDVINRIKAGLTSYIATLDKTANTDLAAKLLAAQTAFNDLTNALSTNQAVSLESGTAALSLLNLINTLAALILVLVNKYNALTGSHVTFDASGIEGAKGLIESYILSLNKLQQKLQALGNIQMAVNRWMGFWQVLNMTKSAINEMKLHIQELDSVMTSISVVTNFSQKDLWGLISQYSKIARQYGVAIKGVYEVSLIYYQQGLQLNDVMTLTTETLKMARIAGLDYATAADYMTTAIRGFKLEMTDAAHVTDVFSALAATTASDTQEIAVAISKTAASAEAVGASFEATSAMMATMISTTRESATNIGTALKSVISRYGEMTSDPSKTVDSEGEEMSLNRVDKALLTVGITLHDTAGQFRDFDDVMLELMEKWDSLDSLSQRYIATLMAGNRQQSRFLALVSNVNEYKKALLTAMDSEGTGELLTLKTLDSIDAKIEKMKVTIQEFYTSSGLEELYKNVLDIITNIVSAANSLPKSFGNIPLLAVTLGALLIATVKSVISLIIALILLGLNSIKGSTNNILIDIVLAFARAGDEAGNLFATKLSTKILSISKSKVFALIANVVGSLAQLGGSYFITQGVNQYGASTSPDQDRVAANSTFLGAGISALGGAISGAAMGAVAGVPGMIVGALSGIATNLPSLITAINMNKETLGRLLELAKKAETLAKEQLSKDKGKQKSLEQALTQLLKLKEALYESAEAAKEYTDYMNLLGDQYPNLINSIDLAGNSIIDITKLENELAKARQTTSISTVEALTREQERIEKEQKIYNELYQNLDLNKLKELNKKDLINSIKANRPYGSTWTDEEILFSTFIERSALGTKYKPSDNTIFKQAEHGNHRSLQDYIKLLYATIPNFEDMMITEINKVPIISLNNNNTNLKNKIKSEIDNYLKSPINDTSILKYLNLDNISDIDKMDTDALFSISEKIQEYISLLYVNASTTLTSVSEALFDALITKDIQERLNKMATDNNSKEKNNALALLQYIKLMSFVYSGMGGLPDEDEIKKLESWILSNSKEAENLLSLDYAKYRNSSEMDFGSLPEEFLLAFATLFKKIRQEAVDLYTNLLDLIFKDNKPLELLNTALFNNQTLSAIQSDLTKYSSMLKSGNLAGAEAYLNNIKNIYKAISSFEGPDLDKIYPVIKDLDLSNPEELRSAADTLTNMGGEFAKIAPVFTNAANRWATSAATLLESLSSSAQETAKSIESSIADMSKVFKYSEALEKALALIDANKDLNLEFKLLYTFDKDVGGYIKTAKAFNLEMASFLNTQAEGVLQSITDLTETLLSPIENIDIKDWLIGSLNMLVPEEARQLLEKNAKDTFASLTNTKIGDVDFDRLWQEYTQIVNAFNNREDKSKEWDEFVKDYVAKNGEQLKTRLEQIQEMPQKMARQALSTFDYTSIASGKGTALNKEELKALLTSANQHDASDILRDFDKYYLELLKGNVDEYNKYLKHYGLGDYKASESDVNRARFEGLKSLYNTLVDDNPVWAALDDTQRVLLDSVGINEEKYNTEGVSSAVTAVWAALGSLADGVIANLDELRSEIAKKADNNFKQSNAGKLKDLLEKYKDGFTADELVELLGNQELLLDKEGNLTELASLYFKLDENTGNYILLAGLNAASVIVELAKILGILIKKTTDLYKLTIKESVDEAIADADKADIGKLRVNAWQSVMSGKAGDRISLADVDDTTKGYMKAAGLIDDISSQFVYIESEKSLNEAIKWMRDWLSNDNNKQHNPLTTRYFLSMVSEWEAKIAKNAAFEGITGEAINQSAAEALSMALNNSKEFNDVQALMTSMGFKWNDAALTWKATAESIKAAREKIQAAWKAEEIDSETYYNLIAALNNTALAINPEQLRRNAVQDIVENYDNLSEESIAAFSTAFEGLGINIRDYITTDEWGKNKVNLAALNLKLAGVGYNVNELFQLEITEIGDAYLQNISTGVSLLSSGTNNLADIGAFVESYNETMGTNLLAENVSYYDDILKGFTIRPEFIRAYILKLAENLKAQGILPEEKVDLWILDNTAEFARENIDIGSFLSSERTLDDVDKIAHAIQTYYELTGESVDKAVKLANVRINRLLMGGLTAVKTAQLLNPNLTETLLAEIYSNAINRWNDAFNEVENVVAGLVVTGELRLVLASLDMVDENGVVKETFNMVSVYAAIYNKMKDTAGATTADLNNAYAKLLTANDLKNIDTMDALENAANMSFDALAQLFNTYGHNLEKELPDLLRNNTVGLTGFGGIRIFDFEAFAENLGLAKNSPEYYETYSKYADSMADFYNSTNNIIDNVAEQIKGLADAKPGKAINVSYLQLTLGDKFTNAIKQYVGEHADLLLQGIMVLDEGVDIAQVITEIANVAAKAGLILPELLAELADAVAEVLSQITSLITGGISGNLKNTDALKLLDWATLHGLGKLDFTLTADGLKLSNDSAKLLYNTINNIDSIQGQIVFKALKESLIESNDNFKSISTSAARTAEMLREFAVKATKEAGYGKYGNFFASMNGNVDLYNRPILNNEDGSYSTLLTTTLDSRNYETDIPWVMNVTPITKDGKKLDDGALGEYIQKLIDGTDGSLEAILEADAKDLGLIIELADAAGKDLDALANSMDDRAEILHEISAIYEEIKKGETFDDTKIKLYQEELNLLHEILAERATTEDASFKFMENAIPSGLNNPLNYFENWGKAWKVLLTGVKEGSMAYQDWYNIITEMNNIAGTSGLKIEIAGVQLDGSMEAAAAAIQKGAQALKVTADGSIKVDLSGFGIDLAAGANSMQEGVDKGIDAIADSLIKMLDSMILLMETIVAMELLGDIDVEGDGIDFSNLFEMTFNEDTKEWETNFEKFSKGYEQYRDYVLKRIDEKKYPELFNKDLAEGVNKTKLKVGDQEFIFGDLLKMEPSELAKHAEDGLGDAYAAVLSAYKAAALSGDYDENHIMESIKAILAGTGFNGDIDIGDMHLTFKLGYVLERDSEGHYIVEGQLFNNEKTALNAMAAAELEDLLGKAKDINTETGEVTYHGAMDATVEVSIDSDTVTYTAHIGEYTVTSTSREGIAGAIKTATMLSGEEWNNINETSDETGNSTFSFTILQEGSAEISLTVDTKIGEVKYKLPDSYNGNDFENPINLKTTKLLGNLKTSETQTVDIFRNVLVKENEVPETVDENAKYAEDNPAKQGITGDASEFLDTAEEATDAANQMSASINITASDSASSVIDGIRSSLNKLVNGGPYKVTVQASVSAGSKGNLGGGTTRNGAKESNLKHYANAKGTLMGELGPELVVSKGRYFVVGLSGPEMVDLDDDAIVFNHLQTQSLLTKGMSSGRGRAITNERNAVSFATGNVDGGPAMASASAALAALKLLRDMWEALKSASVSDLAGAGGGGGGGGGKDKIVDPKAWVKTVERWYNLTQEIAKLEKDITHEETLRSKLLSDFNKNGTHYYNSQRLSLKALREQIAAQELLNLSRQDYYTKRIDALKNEPLGKLYTFDEQGQMHFRDDVTMNGLKGAMNFLTDLMGFDENGKANYTNELKYNILKQYGFDEYMKYNSNGEQILLDADHSGDVTDEERETYYQQATEAWRDRMDSYAQETLSLWDSIKEGENSLLELQTNQNELLQEMRDNLIAVEEDVLKAIEDMRQREIDALQDERDKLEDSTGKYIEGLSDALSKEQEMYDNQLQENDLNQQRRRLAILLRSGGSAADIANLQNEINSNERSRYFDLQQLQIDAIQQASDLLLERMDNLIELMTETLEYQKEYGLLWSEVYDVMSHSAALITSFIMNGNSEFWAKSPLGSATSANDTLFKADQWVGFREDMTDITTDVANLAFAANEQKKANDYKIYDSAMKKEFGSNYDSKGKYKGIFELVYDETGDITKASAAARAEYLKDKKVEELNRPTYTINTPLLTAPSGADSSNGSSNDNNKCKGCAAECTKGCAYSCTGKCVKGCKGNCGTDCERGCATGCSAKCTTTCKEGCKGGCNNTCRILLTSKAKVILLKYASGGMNYDTGLALLDGTKKRPEAVFNARQTHILRDNILSNKPNSLITLLNTYNEAYKDGISVAPLEASGQLIIENATVNMNVEQIANDYDARRAGEQALNEMMRIARKTGAANSIRR